MKREDYIQPKIIWIAYYANDDHPRQSRVLIIMRL